LKSVPFAQAVTSVLAMAVLHEERRQQLLEGELEEQGRKEERGRGDRGGEGRTQEA